MFIIARKINLDNFIIFGKSEFSSDGLKDSILSNILESLIGAIFIDSGYDNAKIVVSTLWDDLINDEKIDLNISNPKSELQETVLSSKKIFLYTNYYLFQEKTINQNLLLCSQLLVMNLYWQ